MTRHTPPPLVAGLDLPGVSNNDPDPRLIWSGTKIVGMATTPWLSREEQEANARLWAQAPRMYEAIRQTLPRLRADLARATKAGYWDGELAREVAELADIIATVEEAGLPITVDVG